MTHINLSKDTKKKYVTFNFYRNGKKSLEDAVWGMTLKAASSMRFRWNEENPTREKVLSEIAGKNAIVPVQLDHTKIVYAISSANDTLFKIGDGLITKNKTLMPVVTVADCMPLYFSDVETGFFGVVHSGWKGTGIAQEAIRLAQKEYGANPKNIAVAIGAHIRDCCYVVNKERADYFALNFTKECVKPLDESSLQKNKNLEWNSGNGPLYALSLEKANLAVLEKVGILDENIVILKECTCCNNVFGSNRRETSGGSTFTVQAAFCGFFPNLHF